MITTRSGIAIVAVLCVAAVAFFALSANSLEKRQVRWLISHQPTDVFSEAAEVFARELSARTNGRLQLEVIEPADIGWGDGDIPNSEVEKRLRNGEVELATAYTVPLGAEYPAFWALNLPYLVGSYEDAEALIESEAADVILDSLDSSDMRALAFTMSGGLRIIASKNFSIDDAGSLKGKRIATSGGPVAEETLRALGAIPVSAQIESLGVPENIDGFETTYSRLSALDGASAYARYINETNHSIFLTTILARADFLDSLSSEDRAALIEAARVAARQERADSRALAAEVKESLAASGSTIVDLPDIRTMLRDMTTSVRGSQYVPEGIRALLAN